MTQEEVKELVDYLNTQSLFGTIVTWNGIGFRLACSCRRIRPNPKPAKNSPATTST